MGVERTFAFVDLAGFTALTEAHGDAEAIATVRSFRARAEAVLAPGDEYVKSIGDAVMLAFETPVAAVTALVRLIEHELVCADATLLPRGGAHHGTAVQDGSDFVGQAVNLAARVAAQASGGTLLATAQVALAARDLGHVVTHVGALELRNVSEPVDVYEIAVGDTSMHVAIDPVCSMRVPTTGPSAIALHRNDEHLWFCGLPCVARYAADPAAFTGRTRPSRIS